uniref:Uncharacterized protein n=1 Tax=Rhizophagus irregularis (strain DAOM 181602 / DAOM 197198 / MUCL 43194) TaxID=747089 RepID=U9U1M1_RHIID
MRILSKVTVLISEIHRSKDKIHVPIVNRSMSIWFSQSTMQKHAASLSIISSLLRDI